MSALYDINPLTGATIEVFYADRTVIRQTGRFWWWHRRVLSGTVWRLVPFSLQLPPRIYAPDRLQPREPLSNSLFHSGLMSVPSFRR